MKLFDMINGKKTYIGCAILAICSALYWVDISVHDGKSQWLSEEQYGAAVVFVSGLTGASLRQAIAKGSN